MTNRELPGSRKQPLADAPPAPQVIESYGDGGFRVSGVVYKGSIIIAPGRTDALAAGDIQALKVTDLATVIEAEPCPEILFLGCGVRTQIAPAGVRKALKKSGIALEPMNTGAACRTYNLLIAEGRPIAGAFIAVD